LKLNAAPANAKAFELDSVMVYVEVPLVSTLVGLNEEFTVGKLSAVSEIDEVPGEPVKVATPLFVSPCVVVKAPTGSETA
jgi:hypothetical protein